MPPTQTNEVKKQDKEVPVRLRDETLECLTWWSNPNDAPVYFNNEIATELRKDKARLDWLLENCLIKEFDLERLNIRYNLETCTRGHAHNLHAERRVLDVSFGSASGHLERECYE